MSKQLSYSSLANKYMKNFREMINSTEDKVDINNSFSLISCRFMLEVFSDEPTDIKDNDFTFDPAERLYFKISENLMNTKHFQDIWNSSDLPIIIENFATSAYHRYMHLLKNPQRSETKKRI